MYKHSISTLKDLSQLAIGPYVGAFQCYPISTIRNTALRGEWAGPSSLARRRILSQQQLFPNRTILEL